MQEVFIKISGNVQGVNFRYYTQIQAQKLNLTGWVRNAPDGTVEILAQGEKENLEKLIAWAKTGPRFAKIEKVEVRWRKFQDSYSEFEIRY